MTRRSGVTLVEVLVAIFIMAIGLIALLTLFPIGILRMMQAIRAERSAESAYNAHHLAIMQDIRNDQAVISDGVFPDLFFNPGPINLGNGLPWLPNADPYGESYPVLVDPIGFIASTAGAQDWVGGVPPQFGGTLRRRPVAFTGGVPANIYKNFTLWDDINFDPTTNPGTPQISGLAILRDTRFSWAYLLRRPQTADRSIVDCSIIVFDQRSLSLTGSLSLEEYVYPGMAYFNPATNTITIEYTSNTVVPPPVRAGDWILDSTYVWRNAQGIPMQGVPATGSAHAYFYRVVATEELVDTSVVPNRRFARYEVQQPIRGFVNYPMVADPTNTSQPAYNGTAIVIKGIAEVFEKGPVRLP